MAGGASLAPSRWSLVAEATEARKQAAVLVHRADDGGAEDQELGVVVRRVPGEEKVALGGVADREVDVLARPVDPLERLLVEEALHAVLLGHLLERRHEELLVVGGHVGALEHRGQFELARGHLVVARLGRDAELEQLALAIHHVGQDTLGDGPEVVVVELLPLGGLGSEQRAAGVEQVGPVQEEAAVDQEVLLLGPGERDHGIGVLVAEEVEEAGRLLGHGLLRAQQRGLVVEGLPGHGDEHGRDAERVAVGVLEDVGRAGHVPAGVAPCLEGRPQPAVGEAGRVGLTLDQGLAGEFGDGVTVPTGLEEAVVLLGGEVGQGVEDVGVVGGPLLHGPVLHDHGHHVGHRRVERLGVLDGGHQRLEDRLGEAFLHHRLGEDVGTEDLAGILVGGERSSPGRRSAARSRWTPGAPCFHSSFDSFGSSGHGLPGTV